MAREDTLTRPTYEIEMTQSPIEFEALLDIVRAENVRSVLEIGSRFGGTLWRIANEMPKGSKVVSIDPDQGQGSGKPGAAESLRACVAKLSELGYDAHLLTLDSTQPATVEMARALGPFDLVFIDGNHEERYVRADWENYGPMGRIVAFHDVCWKHPGRPCAPVDVPKVWNQIRGGYRSKEFHDPKYNFGIGVLWRE
jgi:predicted O-methyltransferase YrrM